MCRSYLWTDEWMVVYNGEGSQNSEIPMQFNVLTLIAQDSSIFDGPLKVFSYAVAIGFIFLVIAAIKDGYTLQHFIEQIRGFLPPYTKKQKNDKLNKEVERQSVRLDG